MGWMDETEKGVAIFHEQRHTNFVELYVDSEVQGENIFINKSVEATPLLPLMRCKINYLSLSGTRTLMRLPVT